VFQSTTWWLDFDANVHVCSYYVARDSSMMVENGLHDSVYDIGTIDIKLTSKKIMQLKNMQHVPSTNKNLLSGSHLYRDGFKVVLESNKFVVLMCG
jgi:hypothetical protein